MEQKLETLIRSYEAYMEERRAVDAKRASLEPQKSWNPNLDVERACERELFHAHKKLLVFQEDVKSFVLDLVQEPDFRTILVGVIQSLLPSEQEVKETKTKKA